MKRIDFHGRVYMVHDDTIPLMFRELTRAEEVEFVVWAVTHSFDEIEAIYHPVIQDRMYKARGN